MTRFRVVKAPDKLGRPGSYAVLSDRPGPVLGERGGLYGWTEAAGDGVYWLTFEQACLASAAANGKASTANMGPREAAEGGAT